MKYLQTLELQPVSSSDTKKQQVEEVSSGKNNLIGVVWAVLTFAIIFKNPKRKAAQCKIRGCAREFGVPSHYDVTPDNICINIVVTIRI